MEYIAQCQICKERINKRCPKQQSYDGTRCPKFRDFNRFGHMSGVLKFIFAVYIGINAALAVLSFWFYYSLNMPIWLLIVQGFITLYLIYAVFAFMKPLPDGAFILKMLVFLSLVMGGLITIAGLLYGKFLSISLPGMFWLILSAICYWFLIKDDEFDYLFPEETRKVYVWDYVFVASQVSSLILLGITLFGVTLF